MRTNIVLDDELVAEATRLSGIKTKKDLVHEALRVFVATWKRKSLLDLAGNVSSTPKFPPCSSLKIPPSSRGG